jgi:hypothetical protein
MDILTRVLPLFQNGISLGATVPRSRLNRQISRAKWLRSAAGVAWIISTASETSIWSESAFMLMTAAIHSPKVWAPSPPGFPRQLAS